MTEPNRKQAQKEQTRRRMVDAASRSFRAHGYAGIGVDAVAKAAGSTSGAFYAHFGSKTAAFEAAVASGLDEVIEALPGIQAEHGTEWVRVFADYYLGRAHREDLACGCAMTTLSPEVVRAGAETRELYEARMKKIVKLAAKGLAGGGKGERRSRAWAMLGTLIGGLTLARAVRDEALAEEIAASVRAAAVATAGATRVRPGGTPLDEPD
ncbi:MAG: TetR/AcrR family transcriptional regulator [Kiloniellales bacterium]|nr:TetR/AcrR family transcriptional regulator [Kiloniellales bacterium]